MNENEFRVQATSLSLIQECPQCFWLAYKFGLKRPSLPVARITTQLDSAIKKWIEKFRSSAQLPDWLERNGFKGTLLGPQNLEFLDENTNIMLVGRLDELLKEVDGYCVIDFKSGKPPESGLAPPYYQVQLEAYAWLVENVYHNEAARVNRGALVYFTLKSGEELENYLLPFDVGVVEVKLDKNTPELLRKAKAILTEEHPPEQGRDCIFCKWRKEVLDAI